MEELFDVYTRDGKYLGVKTKTECHGKNPGFYHKPAWTWVYNSKKEILVQKRSMMKKNYPGYWSGSCAGHIVSGESVEEGVIREAKEEIGLDVNKEDVKVAFQFIDDDTWEIGQVVFIKADKSINEFVLQEEEVAEIRWVSLDELKEILYSDKWPPTSDEYKRLIIKEFEELFSK